MFVRGAGKCKNRKKNPGQAPAVLPERAAPPVGGSGEGAGGSHQVLSQEALWNRSCVLLRPPSAPASASDRAGEGYLRAARPFPREPLPAEPPLPARNPPCELRAWGTRPALSGGSCARGGVRRRGSVPGGLRDGGGGDPLCRAAGAPRARPRQPPAVPPRPDRERLRRERVWCSLGEQQ